MPISLQGALLFAAAGEGPTSPFEVNFGLFFWTWAVFLVLLFVLGKFAWPAIVKATEERERTIRHQLAEAEQLNADARSALAEGQRLQTEASAEAQTLLAEARNVAEKERTAALEKVKQEQDALLERARRDIASEKERAVQALRREAVDLSLAAAAKLVGQRLDSEADRKLVEAYLDSVEVQH